MTDIPEQMPPTDPDPISKLKVVFEETFPELRATEIALVKKTAPVTDRGWITVRETGEFVCTIRAERRG